MLVFDLWIAIPDFDPSARQVQQVHIGRTVHVPNLGLFFGGPGKMHFKAGKLAGFMKIMKYLGVRTPK